MDLITRCPACATMFRVTEDQLDIAQGWVRCGQCGEVFEACLHAVEQLDALPEAASVAQSPEVPESELPEVSFVRAAQRKAFWQSSMARTLLGMICLGLLAALALQWVAREKDALAAQEPRLAPWLAALCRPLGCQLRPLRRIEALVIENASFSRVAPNAYRLRFVFRNTGDAAVEIPALEVTLTDRQDQALVRRVVMPEQFGANAITLAAHAELAGALSLKITSGDPQGTSSLAQAGFLPVAGYRILAFYP